MNIFVVEEYESGDMWAFRELADANHFVQEYYQEHIDDFFSEFDLSKQETRDMIINDMRNLNEEFAFIEDVMYIHKATFLQRDREGQIRL